MNMTPIGRFSAFQKSGTLILGWPVKFATCVNPANRSISMTACSITPGILSGALNPVAVMTR